MKAFVTIVIYAFLAMVSTRLGVIAVDQMNQPSDSKVIGGVALIAVVAAMWIMIIKETIQYFRKGKNAKNEKSDSANDSTGSSIAQ